MENNEEEIKQCFADIENILKIDLGTDISKKDDNNIGYAWYVGATGNNSEGHWQDFSEQFIKEGRWENLSAPEDYTEDVNKIVPGDKIAIKATYTKKNNLPFDNNNRVVSTMSIKAIGIVTENYKDGRNIKVDWTQINPIREWFGSGVLRTTIHLVKASDGYIKKSLLDFTFNNEEQDYSICEDFYKDSECDTTEISTDSNKILLPQRTQRIDNNALNEILYGAPGTGKTYSTVEHALAIVEKRDLDLSKKTPEERKNIMNKYNEYVNKGQIVFTTFHQNYSYEDFIQGLRPKTINGNMEFKTIDGVFKKVADSAMLDATNEYVIIIDEINRANISRVFGELITLIEDDKRWGEINQMSVTLPSGDIFAVPNNLHIIGTMNSADKSISLIDVALRRRFKFIEQSPDSSFIDDTFVKDIFEKLNKILVEELDSTDLLIGHSYFINKSKNDICDIFNNSIIPLLYEYFYDNKKKVTKILEQVLKNTEFQVDKNKTSRLKIGALENNGD